jgi:hypothetical protein
VGTDCCKLSESRITRISRIALISGPTTYYKEHRLNGTQKKNCLNNKVLRKSTQLPSIAQFFCSEKINPGNPLILVIRDSDKGRLSRADKRRGQTLIPRVRRRGLYSIQVKEIMP